MIYVMKRYIIIIIVLLITTPFAKAQLWKMKRYEATASVGTTQFFGDIGGFSPTVNILGFKDISLRQTRFNMSTSLRYRILADVSARINLAFGYLHATDARGSNEARGYEAVTSIFEPTIIAEYCFIKNKTENSYIFLKGGGSVFGSLISSLDIYVLAGVGGVKYMVKGNNALVANGMQTGGFALAVPLGLGTSFTFSPDFNFGLEIGGRYTTSDYIDGYSSQYSKSNDVYYFLNATVTYKMKTGKNGLPSFRQ
jgi:hypothetical protein